MKKNLALIIIALAICGCNSIPPNGDYQYDSRCGHIHRVDEPCPIEIPEPPKIPLPHNHKMQDPCDDNMCPLHGEDWP